MSRSLARLTANEQLPQLLANLNNLTQDARGLLDAQSRADLKRILADLAQITKVDRRPSLGAGATALSKPTPRSIASPPSARRLDERLPELLDADHGERARAARNDQ